MKRLRLFAVLLCVSATMALFAASMASATVTPYISFQGKLTNTDGTNVGDGSYSVVFSIYTVSSGGSAVWSETKSVTVSGGLFQTNLGDTTSLPGSVNFNSSSLYLGIKVGSDAEMTPRIQLTAAPQAFNADMLDGIDSSGFVQLSPGSQQSGNINVSGTVTSGAVNGLTLAQAADGFTVAGGTTSRTLTVQGANITIGSTIQPTSAGALSIQSNGANALNLDAGGAAAINIGVNGTSVNGINIGNATSNPNIAFSGSGSFGTTTGAVNLNGNTTVVSGKNLTITSGSFSQTFSATTASNAHAIAVTNANTGAGVAINGINLTPTNNATPSSGTNSMNVINFAAGSALGGSDQTNGISFASATGYTNFISSPSFMLSSSGAISGVTTISTSSTINSNTFSSSTLTFGAASTATVQSAASQALTITANAASTWSTSAGTLTIQSGSGTVSLGSSTVLNASGALTINSGAATTLTVDSGTTGALNLGTSANAKTITIGNTTGATTIANLVGAGTNAFSVQGPSSAVLFQIDTTNSRVYVGNPTADATGVLLVLDSKNTSGDPTGVNGSMYYNSSNNRFRCYQNSTWQSCLGTPAFSDRHTSFFEPLTTAATSPTGYGLTVPTSSGTATASPQAESMYVNYATTTTANSTGGLTTLAATQTQTRWLPRYMTRIRVDSSAVTSVRYWVALGNSALTGSDGTGQFVGVRFSTNTSDPAWMCASDDGTTLSTTTTGVSVTAGSYYDIIIDMSISGTLSCSVAANGGSWTTVSKSTNLPTNSTSLGLMESITTLTTAARNIGIAYGAFDTK
ncbi:MAG TPA: hypothetical protein VJP80_02670 [Candidatus Saccharimonadales bacterium]|nr:hypothetical protein [Candidatus Saccharimonadales bacterium]